MFIRESNITENYQLHIDTYQNNTLIGWYLNKHDKEDVKLIIYIDGRYSGLIVTSEERRDVERETAVLRCGFSILLDSKITHTTHIKIVSVKTQTSVFERGILAFDTEKMKANAKNDNKLKQKTGEETDVRVAFICPSINKACGIARYTSYIVDELNGIVSSASMLNSAAEAARLIKTKGYTHLIVQHEYGLFDYNSPLGCGETTFQLLHTLKDLKNSHSNLKIAIVMHTIVLHDHVLNAINKQIFSSGIPVFTLNKQGAELTDSYYLEHGVRILTGSPFEQELNLKQGVRNKKIGHVFGSFGLLSAGKDLNQIIETVKEINGELLANYASTSNHDIAHVNQLIQKANIQARIGHEFLEEDKLIRRLKKCDAVIMHQMPIVHYATSGSARLIMNLMKPIFVNCARQFDDLSDAVILYHSPSEIEKVMEDDCLYYEAVNRIKDFVGSNKLGDIYRELFCFMNTDPKNLTQVSASGIGKSDGSILNNFMQEVESYRSKNLDIKKNKGLIFDILNKIETRCINRSLESTPRLSNENREQAIFSVSGIKAAAQYENNLIDYLILNRKGLPEELQELLKNEDKRELAKALDLNVLIRFLNNNDQKQLQNIYNIRQLFLAWFKNYSHYWQPTWYSKGRGLSTLVASLLPLNHLFFFLETCYGVSKNNIIATSLKFGLPFKEPEARIKWLSEVAKIDNSFELFNGRTYSDYQPFKNRLNFFEDEFLIIKSNAEFLFAIYQAVLKREPDHDGFINYYTPLVNEKITRRDTIINVLKSKEAKASGVKVIENPCLEKSMLKLKEVEVQLKIAQIQTGSTLIQKEKLKRNNSQKVLWGHFNKIFAGDEELLSNIKRDLDANEFSDSSDIDDSQTGTLANSNDIILDSDWVDFLRNLTLKGKSIDLARLNNREEITAAEKIGQDTAKKDFAKVLSTLQELFNKNNDTPIYFDATGRYLPNLRIF